MNSSLRLNNEGTKEWWSVFVHDLKCIVKKRPPVEVDIRLNNNISLEEEQLTWTLPGYCRFLKPWTFISPFVLELLHKAH